MYVGGPFRRRRLERADDVFLALEHANEQIPADALLSAATFEVRFSDGRKPRPVTIRHGNKATYTRDTDADLIESFLRRGGFVKGGGHALVAVA